MEPPLMDAVNYSAHVLHTKVDPTSIPLPPYSPPVSTVSFSSRSSASKSSASYDTQSSDQSGSTAPNVTTRVNGMGHVRARSSIDVLSIQVSPPLAPREFLRDKWSPGLESDDDHDDYDNDNDDPERKRKNEAKSNRKIADLEITNKSLLAINSSLEAQKHRQAKEIRDLRRKLRESILVLPPRAYRAAKSSLTETGALVQDEELEDDEEDEEVDEVEEKEVLQGKNDESYRRVMTLLEALLESGRRALESKPEDFTGTGTGGAKVLSEEEARPWRGDDVDNLSLMESDRDDVSVYLAAGGPEDVRPISPSRIAIPDDDVDSEVEDETSLFVSEEDEFRRSSLPPITVTPSPSP
ncbi:hypothetical protein BDW22DRAFT_1436298 [Trametopsis cervina]|nr:hypothetical protein BDW22DRAFT_1436298 [Trametopsis cervina]